MHGVIVFTRLLQIKHNFVPNFSSPYKPPKFQSCLPLLSLRIPSGSRAMRLLFQDLLQIKHIFGPNFSSPYWTLIISKLSQLHLSEFENSERFSGRDSGHFLKLKRLISTNGESNIFSTGSPTLIGSKWKEIPPLHGKSNRTTLVILLAWEQ